MTTRQRQIADHIQKKDYEAAVTVALSRQGRASERSRMAALVWAVGLVLEEGARMNGCEGAVAPSLDCIAAFGRHVKPPGIGYLRRVEP